MFIYIHILCYYKLFLDFNLCLSVKQSLCYLSLPLSDIQVQLHAFLEIKTETIYNRMDHMLITPAKQTILS